MRKSYTFESIEKYDEVIGNISGIMAIRFLDHRDAEDEAHCLKCAREIAITEIGKNGETDLILSDVRWDTHCDCEGCDAPIDLEALKTTVKEIRQENFIEVMRTGFTRRFDVCEFDGDEDKTALYYPVDFKRGPELTGEVYCHKCARFANFDSFPNKFDEVDSMMIFISENSEDYSDPMWCEICNKLISGSDNNDG